MTVRSTILAAAALVAGLINVTVAAAPAIAQTPASIAVSYGDLNLNSDAGRTVLDRRIAAAATQLCGEALPVELGRAAASRACFSETLAAVQPQRDAAVSQRFGTVQVSQADLSLRVTRAAN